MCLSVKRLNKQEPNQTVWWRKPSVLQVLINLYVATSEFDLSCQKKADALKEKIRKKYEDMKRVLDEDLRITLTQLDTEQEATEKLVEDKIEECYHLTQELEKEMSNTSAEVKTQESDVKVNTRNT